MSKQSDFTALVRQAAAGRWLDILPAVAPALAEACHSLGRHVPCPVHGGKDGFRLFDDAAERGGGICNSCGARDDGFELLKWVLGVQFTEARDLVARHLGIERPARSRSRHRSSSSPLPPSANGHAAAPATATAVTIIQPIEHKTTAESATASQNGHGSTREDWRHRWLQAFKARMVPDDGTISSYFAARGIPGPYPSLFRVAYFWPYKDRIGDNEYVLRGSYPTIGTPITSLDGRVVGIHQTYLDGLQPKKANVKDPKKKLAAAKDATKGAAARLAPISEVSDVLAIAEGIETSLAIRHATGLPCWAALDAGGLERIELPDTVKAVWIWSDNDLPTPKCPNGAGQSAAALAATRLVSEGRTVYVLTPPDADTDWLDVLNTRGADFFRLAREKAEPWIPSPDDIATWEAKQRKAARKPRAGGETAAQAAKQAADEEAAAQLTESILNRAGPLLAAGDVLGFYSDDPLLSDLARLRILSQPRYMGVRDSLRQKKIRSREFDAVMKPKIEAALRGLAPEHARGETGGFFEADGQICREKLGPNGPLIVQCCNFTARIVEETVFDDGLEQQACFGLVGRHKDGREFPRIDVPATEFEKLRWLAGWGSDAIVWPGEGRVLPAAIQALSLGKNKARKIIFTHLGWRKIAGEWCYLHKGGAIRTDRTDRTVSVAIGRPLNEYELPCVGESNEPPGHIIMAIRESLCLRKLPSDPSEMSKTPEDSPDGSPEQSFSTYPLIAAVYRSVLGGADFGIHLVGTTGVFKSELAALCQQHFGAGLTARNLPCSWSSTANSLEAIAFAAKDALLVIDDFCLAGGASDAHRLHREADRIFRAQGNSSGRQRMKADGSLKDGRSPRGLILSTGEEVPRGQSLQARLLVIEVSPGSINKERLTQAQQLAANGVYARSLAEFIRWCAGQLDELKAELKSEAAKLRAQLAVDGWHARTPGIIAELQVAFRIFLRFAVEAGAITPVEQADHDSACLAALKAIAGVQSSQRNETEPAEHFARLVAGVLASGRGHLAATDGNTPYQEAAGASESACGWRKVSIGRGEFEWRPEGRRIGWIDDGQVYFEPEAVYSEIQRLAADQGEVLHLTPRALWRQLSEKGRLASRDEARKRYTIRKTVQGVYRETINMKLESVLPVESDAQGKGYYKTNGHALAREAVSF